MDNKAICDKIDESVRSLLELKRAILGSAPTPTAPPAEAAVVEAQNVDDFESFESLKKALFSNKWPEAVNPNLICNPNSETDKKERGVGIIELIVEESITNGKFLDYGCGEGHCVDAAISVLNCAHGVGFDTKPHDYWASSIHGSKVKFTSVYEEAVAAGPYDAILIFDVIDHLTSEDPVTILKKASDILKPTGKIYLRCHPWISRHGTHLYHHINKAYAHLVFTEQEIKQLTSETLEPSINVVYPIITYERWIQDAGLQVASKRQISEKVEPFFKIPKIAERIIRNTKTNNFPEFQMGIQFLDYVLKK